MTRNKPQSRAQFIIILRGRQRQQQSYELLNYCHSRGHEQSALRMCAHFFWFSEKRHDTEKSARDALKRKEKFWGRLSMRHLNFVFANPHRKRENLHQQLHGNGKKACEKAVRGFSIARIAHININSGNDYAKKAAKGKLCSILLTFPAINLDRHGWRRNCLICKLKMIKSLSKFWGLKRLHFFLNLIFHFLLCIKNH